LGEIGAKIGVVDEMSDAILPRFDHDAIAKRKTEPLAREPLAHGRDAALKDPKERAFDSACAHGALDLEAPQRGGVDGDVPRGGVFARRAKMRKPGSASLGADRRAGLSFEQVPDKRP